MLPRASGVVPSIFPRLLRHRPSWARRRASLWKLPEWAIGGDRHTIRRSRDVGRAGPAAGSKPADVDNPRCRETFLRPTSFFLLTQPFDLKYTLARQSWGCGALAVLSHWRGEPPHTT